MVKFIARMLSRYLLQVVIYTNFAKYFFCKDITLFEKSELISDTLTQLTVIISESRHSTLSIVLLLITYNVITIP